MHDLHEAHLKAIMQPSYENVARFANIAAHHELEGDTSIKARSSTPRRMRH